MTVRVHQYTQLAIVACASRDQSCETLDHMDYCWQIMQLRTFRTVPFISTRESVSQSRRARAYGLG
jgi:hypothetical protein